MSKIIWVVSFFLILLSTDTSALKTLKPYKPDQFDLDIGNQLNRHTNMAMSEAGVPGFLVSPRIAITLPCFVGKSTKGSLIKFYQQMYMVLDYKIHKGPGPGIAVMLLGNAIAGNRHIHLMRKLPVIKSSNYLTILSRGGQYHYGKNGAFVETDKIQYGVTQICGKHKHHLYASALHDMPSDHLGMHSSDIGAGLYGYESGRYKLMGIYCKGGKFLSLAPYFQVIQNQIIAAKYINMLLADDIVANPQRFHNFRRNYYTFLRAIYWEDRMLTRRLQPYRPEDIALGLKMLHQRHCFGHRQKVAFFESRTDEIECPGEYVHNLQSTHDLISFHAFAMMQIVGGNSRPDFYWQSVAPLAQLHLYEELDLELEECHASLKLLGKKDTVRLEYHNDEQYLFRKNADPLSLKRYFISDVVFKDLESDIRTATAILNFANSGCRILNISRSFGLFGRQTELALQIFASYGGVVVLALGNHREFWRKSDIVVSSLRSSIPDAHLNYILHKPENKKLLDAFLFVVPTEPDNFDKIKDYAARPGTAVWKRTICVPTDSHLATDKGEDLLATGSSTAAARASGYLAALKELAENTWNEEAVSAQEIANIMLDNARKPALGSRYRYGCGILNVHEAIKYIERVDF